MSKIVLDAATLGKFKDLSGPAELCDESGRSWGRYFPILGSDEVERLAPDISEEELQRRFKSNQKTYTTAEVLAHLEKL